MPHQVMNPDMINHVQNRKGGNRVTPEQIALFKEAFDNTTKSVPVPLGTEGWELIRSMAEETHQVVTL